MTHCQVYHMVLSFEDLVGLGGLLILDSAWNSKQLVALKLDGIAIDVLTIQSETQLVGFRCDSIKAWFWVC